MSKKRDQIQKEKEERRKRRLEESLTHESKYAEKSRLRRISKLNKPKNNQYGN